MSRRPLAGVVSLALATPLLLLCPTASAATPAKPYDFNGDGHPDLVVGASFLKVGEYNRGGVAVLSASKTGLAARALVLKADASQGGADQQDGFGEAFASGDFDGDGYADLAVGAPNAYRQGKESAGAVEVYHGSIKGLTATRSVELLAPGGPAFDTAFGNALAAADFDGDGRSDLAVSAPYQYEAGPSGAGTVYVFRGAAKGLSVTSSSALRDPGPSGRSDDYFGGTLAVGDLDSDGRPDLAVGSTDSGAVNACYGTPSGLPGCTRLTVDPALVDASSLAVGNVSGSSRPEIVVGVSVYGDKTGGRVETLALSGTRASTTTRRTELTQDSPGVRGGSQKGDRFGSSVVLGDLDRDGYADLLVGAPGEDKERGRVTVVFGGRDGYRTSGGLIYDQSTKGVPGKAEKKDRFGASVGLLDHDGDGHLDLTVGAPGEDGDDGAVTLLRGAGTSFTTKGSRTATLKALGYSGGAGGRFGDELGR